MSLVFAFGPNLDAADRDSWLRDHGAAALPRAVSRVILLDRRLSFERFGRSRGGGVLTLSVATGHAVEGMLLEATATTLALLDTKQGHPDAYLREEVHAVLPDGTLARSWVYDVPPARRTGHVPPTQAYLDVVRRGLLANGLGTAALDAAAAGRAGRPLAGHVFVYGTLRTNCANAHLLAGLPRHPATVRGVLHDLGAHPALCLGEGRVVGELVPLDLARLPALDALEDARPFGAPGVAYRRTVVEATRTDGSQVPAQCYVMDGSDAPIIPGGDWLAVGDRRAAWRERSSSGA